MSCLLTTALKVLMYFPLIKSLYYKFDASHFKTTPRASVGGVEIGASRLRVSPPLPTLARALRRRTEARRGPPARWSAPAPLGPASEPHVDAGPRRRRSAKRLACASRGGPRRRAARAAPAPRHRHRAAPRRPRRDRRRSPTARALRRRTEARRSVSVGGRGVRGRSVGDGGQATAGRLGD